MNLKRRLFGRPFASEEEDAQLLPKRLALPVFASDPLSSVAYATEEAMLVLALAGTAAFALLTPISLAIAALLVIVIVSYRQTIKAYPDGGGAFIVANDNIGIRTGAVAASALLIDYVLTVSVSVAAGVAAITSAAPALIPWRLGIALGFVALLTIANLRGVKEASTLFALPTYLFVATVGTMLVVGFAKCLDGVCPTAISSGADLEAEVAVIGLFLILRAFASGSTALTGVEAVANGVQAFRAAKVAERRRHARDHGCHIDHDVSRHLDAGPLVRRSNLGGHHRRIRDGDLTDRPSCLRWGRRLLPPTGVHRCDPDPGRQHRLPGLPPTLRHPGRHKLVPRQFLNRGDRLVFSNGIITLALVAAALLIVFHAEVSRLIQLYVVGVFTAFTLSQTGMVRHWLKTRERGWRRSVAINTVGALTTGVVLIVVATVKFSHGAWIVILMMPILVSLMLSTRRHYLGVAAQLKLVPVEAEPRPTRIIVLVAHHDEGTDRALRYAELVNADAVTCVHAEEPAVRRPRLHVGCGPPRARAGDHPR